MKKSFLMVVFLGITTLLAGQAILLDTTYGINSRVSSDLIHLSTNTIVGENMSLLPDGSIVMGGEKPGNTNILGIRKYNPNGMPDTTFTPPQPYFSGYNVSTSVQPDGRILLCGTQKWQPNHIGVIRFDAFGNVDSTFGNAGIADTDVKLVLFSHVFGQKDGKVVVSGARNVPFDSTGNLAASVTRLNADGSFDTTFANQGQFLLDVSDDYEFVHVGLEQPDGKLLFGGMSYGQVFIFRLLPDGTPDSTFSNDGIVTDISGWPDHLALQPDGKMVLIGNIGDKAFVARYHADGSRDTDFGNDGVVVIAASYEGVSASVLPNGKILGAFKKGTVPSAVEVLMAQLLPDGNLDPSFGINGLYEPGIKMRSRTLHVQGNTAIVGGQGINYRMQAIRLLLNLHVGLLDSDFEGEPPLLLYPNPLSGPFTLECSLRQAAVVQVSLFDQQGKRLQVLKKAESLPAGDHSFQLNCPASLPAGSYVVSLEVGGKPLRSLQILKQ